ncbi:biotin--[acetyl-CoA-carboxylase] ligase, partial [Xanthomonas perforans]
AQPAPEQGVAVLLAERQTGGRGRRGRQWTSPLGAHIYLSASRRFNGGLGQLAGLSLAVGVAVAEALRGCGFADVGLKWPNDLLARQRKLGGLLIEGGGEMAGNARAVIGLGLNVHMPATAAASIDQPWIDLDTLAGGPVSRDQVTAAVLSGLLPALDLFEAQGLAPFLGRYADLDVLHGRTVQVEEAGTHHRGVALGLAADGALRVQLGETVRLFHSGEVSVRPA